MISFASKTVCKFKLWTKESNPCGSFRPEMKPLRSQYFITYNVTKESFQSFIAKGKKV